MIVDLIKTIIGNQKTYFYPLDRFSRLNHLIIMFIHDMNEVAYPTIFCPMPMSELRISLCPMAVTSYKYTNLKLNPNSKNPTPL